mmetsp:Transcript_12674/g.20502  ORF Transcript_12674/g.20502 Transcript_12674/m.20502 type:complete len:215 (-) Transcript_12674:587-1231(-)
MGTRLIKKSLSTTWASFFSTMRRKVSFMAAWPALSGIWRSASSATISIHCGVKENASNAALAPSSLVTFTIAKAESNLPSVASSACSADCMSSCVEKLYPCLGGWEKINPTFSSPSPLAMASTFGSFGSSNREKLDASFCCSGSYIACTIAPCFGLTSSFSFSSKSATRIFAFVCPYFFVFASSFSFCVSTAVDLALYSTLPTISSPGTNLPYR